MNSSRLTEVFASTGTLWRELVGDEPGQRLILPKIVSLSRDPFRCGNGMRLLETGDRPSDDIASAVGYENPAFFRRLFKRCTGLTMGKYRRMFRPISDACHIDAGTAMRANIALQTQGTVQTSDSSGDVC